MRREEAYYVTNLEMCPTNLDDGIECLGFSVQSIAKFRECGNKRMSELGYGSNVHSSGKPKGDKNIQKDMDRKGGRVIAALAHVDMVIGVYRCLGTKLAAEDFNGAVRDDLSVCQADCME